MFQPKPRARRASMKTPAPKAAPSPATPAPRKRGRPRKDAVLAVLVHNLLTFIYRDVLEPKKTSSQTRLFIYVLALRPTLS